MTIAELVRQEVVSRQTIYARKKKCKIGPTGKSKPNRRGKRSPDYQVLDASISKYIPRWKLFEIRCVSEGINPVKVLELLLSRCRGIDYGDPDMFAMAVMMVFHSSRLFLGSVAIQVDSIERTGETDDRYATTLEGEVALIICQHYGESVRLGKSNFREAWASAKMHVYRSLLRGYWRYDVIPMIENIDDRHRLIMRPRWIKLLLNESRNGLGQLGMLLTMDTHENFLRYFHTLS